MWKRGARGRVRCEGSGGEARGRIVLDEVLDRLSATERERETPDLWPEVRAAIGAVREGSPAPKRSPVPGHSVAAPQRSSAPIPAVGVGAPASTASTPPPGLRRVVSIGSARPASTAGAWYEEAGFRAVLAGFCSLAVSYCFISFMNYAGVQRWMGLMEEASSGTVWAFLTIGRWWTLLFCKVFGA